MFPATLISDSQKAESVTLDARYGGIRARGETLREPRIAAYHLYLWSSSFPETLLRCFHRIRRSDPTSTYWNTLWCSMSTITLLSTFSSVAVLLE